MTGEAPDVFTPRWPGAYFSKWTTKQRCIRVVSCYAKEKWKKKWLLLYWGIRSSPFGKLNPNCRWRPSSNNPLTSFFFFFWEMARQLFEPQQTEKKKQVPKKWVGKFCFLFSPLIITSAESAAANPCRLLWRAKLLTFFYCDGFHCPLLLASPFSPFLEFHLVSMSSPGFF